MEFLKVALYQFFHRLILRRTGREQVFAAKDAVDGEPIYLLLTPAFAYEPRHNKECYFYNDKDETGRALQISVNDDFEVSAEAITALATDPVVGQFVTWNPTTRKYVEAASAPTSGICVAEIVERKDYYFGGKVEVRYILHVLSL